MKSFRLSLTFSILAVLSSILLLNWFLLGTLSFSLSKKDLYSMKGRQGSALLSTILVAVPRPLELGTLISSGFSGFARTLQELPDFAGFMLLDKDEKVIYSVVDRIGPDQKLADTIRSCESSFNISPGAREMLLYAPVMNDTGCIGAARLALSLSGEHERLARSQRLLVAYFILDFLLLLGLGFIFLRRSVIAPIRRLNAAIERVASGDYGQTVHVPGSAEIAELSDSFNAMLGTLSVNRAEVKRHVLSLEEINRELKAAREESIRSERLASIGLLAAGTAHEIGTPLASVIGYAGILSEDLATDPEKRDYAVRIEQEAAKIDRIVRDLLDYARPAKCELSRVEIVPLLEETVAMLKGQGAFRDIAVTVSSQDKTVDSYIDRFQFQQVLINLLLNARDAVSSDGFIELQSAPEDPVEIGSGSLSSGEARGFRQIRIDIRDNGAGIPADNLERIFDPFFTTKEPGKGTGLGLSIAARIIDSFGGSISVESKTGSGSCFSIFLPSCDGGDV